METALRPKNSVLPPGHVRFSGSLPSGEEECQSQRSHQRKLLTRAREEKGNIEYSSGSAPSSERQTIQEAISSNSLSKSQVGNVRFKGSLPSGDEDYQAVLARQRKTLARAREEKGNIEYSAGSAPLSKRQAIQEAVEKNKFKFFDSCLYILFSFSFIPTILAGSFGIYTASRVVANANAANAAVPESEEQKDFCANALGAGVLTLLSGIVGLVCVGSGLVEYRESVHYAAALNSLKGIFRERARLKRLSRDILKLQPAKDDLDRKMVEILNQKINALTERFALRFREKYQSVPDFQKYCREVFGEGESALPNGKDLRELFEFFLYQHLQESKPSSLNGLQSPVSETEFTKRLFSMLCIGAKMGDLFKFTLPQPGLKGKEAFNQALLPEIEIMDQLIQSQVDTARDLLRQQKEVENYISLARVALAPLELGVLDRKAEADELKTLIREFDQRKDKITQALQVGIFQEGVLKESGSALFLDETLLNDLKTELSQFMTRLKAVLLKENQKEQLQLQASSLLCEVSSSEMSALESPPTQSAAGETF